MHVATQEVGEKNPRRYPRTHHVEITVTLDLPVELTVKFYSASRTYTLYQIFDQHGAMVGERSFEYAATYNPPNQKLVDDLNVLLEEFGATLSYDQFEAVSKQAAKECDARCGWGVEGGDVVIKIR